MKKGRQLDTGLPVTVERSRRARRVRVKVTDSGDVVVVLPARSPLRAADEAVRELRPWIDRRRAAVADAHAVLGTPPGSVPYLGRSLRVVAEAGRHVVSLDGDSVRVPAAEPAPALERWYRRQARAEVAARLDAACARTGSAYTRLSIRDQSTRWASCSASGGMSFNWRLMLAPSPILDYVVEHEVCHLEVRDHSPRFWALLETRVPDWREPSRWLRSYSAALNFERVMANATPPTREFDQAR